MADRFSRYYTDLNSPAVHPEPVTPSDDTDLNYVSRAIYIATTGNLNVIMTGYDGNDITVLISNLAAGVVHPLRVKRVLATNTTATGIISFT